MFVLAIWILILLFSCCDLGERSRINLQFSPSFQSASEQYYRRNSHTVHQQHLRTTEGKISAAVTFHPHSDFLNLSLITCYNLNIWRANLLQQSGILWNGATISFSVNAAQSFLSRPRWITRCLFLFISHLCDYCHADAGLFGFFTLAIKMYLILFFSLSLSIQSFKFFNSSRDAIHQLPSLAQHHRIHTETFQLPNCDCACIPLSNCFYYWNNLIYINIYVHTYA